MGQVLQDFVHRYATTLAGQMGIKAHNYRQCKSAHLVIETLIRVRWSAIWNHVENESDSTIAKLARSGLGNFSEIPKDRVKMADVHRDDNGGVLPWMNLDWRGADMVTQIATTAVVAAMAENIWEEIEKQKAREALHYSEFRDELPERQPRGVDRH